jgi:hypothetical protein
MSFSERAQVSIAFWLSLLFYAAISCAAMCCSAQHLPGSMSLTASDQAACLVAEHSAVNTVLTLLFVLWLQFFTMDCRGCGNSQAEKMGVDESRLGGI